MSLSNQVQSLQLEYIPHFCENPDHHLLGFLRCSHMNDRDWYQVRACLQNLFSQMYCEDVRPLLIKNGVFFPADVPLHFSDQRDHRGDTPPCVGFALSKIPREHVGKSYLVKKINRLAIQRLFALPFRAQRASDASLLARLIRDGINPGVPTLEEICIEIAALHVSKAKIKHLPILLQNAIICRKTKRQFGPIWASLQESLQ